MYFVLKSNTQSFKFSPSFLDVRLENTDQRHTEFNIYTVPVVLKKELVEASLILLEPFVICSVDGTSCLRRCFFNLPKKNDE